MTDRPHHPPRRPDRPGRPAVLQCSTAPPRPPETSSSPRWATSCGPRVELDTGAAIADPFRPSGDLVDLLRLHARGERRSARRALGRLLPRAA